MEIDIRKTEELVYNMSRRLGVTSSRLVFVCFEEKMYYINSITAVSVAITFEFQLASCHLSLLMNAKQAPGFCRALISFCHCVQSLTEAKVSNMVFLVE